MSSLFLKMTKNFESKKGKEFDKRTIAMYVQNTSGEYTLSNSNTFPTEGYELNLEKSSCTNGGVLSQNSETKKINVTISNTDSCVLYFDKEVFNVVKAVNAIKNNQKPGGINGTVSNFDAAVTTSADSGVFEMADDYGTSYYYRGVVENNYVKFAGYYWRIIRINGDGSLRIFYAGKTPHENGKSGYDENIALEEYAIAESPWNTKYDDAKYVGYMFGGVQGEASTSKEQAQSNDTPSTVKGVLDAWYETNIQNAGYAEYVSDTLFCNDRSTVSTPSSFGSQIGDTGLGYDKNITVFGYWNRFDKDNSNNVSNVQSILKCANKNDAFTVSDTTKGNGKLSYPIGLVTADEVSLAGGVPLQTNIYNYLYNPSYYWTFSPAGFFYNNAGVSMVGGGYLYSGGVDDRRGAVVPVINLSTEFVADMVGDGTMSKPYMLVEG